MAEVEALAKQHKPNLIVAGWSAYSRHLDFDKFRRIADEVGAYLMVDMAHTAGLVAAGLHPNPVPIADITTTTTTTTTRPSAGHAAASSSAAATWPRRSIAPCSLDSRAARSNT